MPLPAALRRIKKLLPTFSKEHRILSVIIIAASFFALEVAIAFITHSLALLADAFHIFSDILGYMVAWLAARYVRRPARGSAQFTFGYRKAEELGGFFNGAFLGALGVSVILQSIERFIEPSRIQDPVLVMAVGAAGIGSNVLMFLILGGHAHGHSHGHDHDLDHNDESHEEHHHPTPNEPDHTHSPSDPSPGEHHHGHAHARPKSKTSKGHHDVNVLGILIHILGDALNSVAVIISAGIYLATGFVYADPIASVLVGGMIIGTAVPLLVRSGRSLLGAAPQHIDVAGVKEDVERISGVGSVHDLHVWSMDAKNPVASLHLLHSDDSLSTFEDNAEAIRQCLHLWGLHNVTIQPESSLTGMPTPQAESVLQLAEAEEPRVEAVIAGDAADVSATAASSCARSCYQRCHAAQGA